MNPFDVLKNMLILLQKADGINRFFIDNDINHVAIYGLGCIGQRVYEEVKRCGIAVDFAIDKDADCIESEEVRIVKPEELRKCENDTELIIVTPMDYYYEIKESIEEMTEIDVISIGEIIAYCIDGETFCHSFRRREIDSPSNDAVENADVGDSNAVL